MSYAMTDDWADTSKEDRSRIAKLKEDRSRIAKLISDIEGIASNVANCSMDSQASDDCATICQMIQDFKLDVFLR